MLISYDPTAEAGYIKVNLRRKVARTIRLSEDMLVDVDRKGHLIGVELLHPASANLRTIANRFHCPELLKIRPKKLHEVFA